MSKAKEVTKVKKLSYFIEVINKLKEKETHRYFFRGQANYEKKQKDINNPKDPAEQLSPSIYRDGRIQYEHKFFNDIILTQPQEFANEKMTIEKLVKMQHYGVPTRLLDITSNPLAALYFACEGVLRKKEEKEEEKKEKEKEESSNVFIFSINKDNIKPYNSRTVAILSNLAKREYPEISEGLKKYYEDISIIDKKNIKNKDEIWKIKNTAREYFNNNYAGYLVSDIKEDFRYFEAAIDPEDFKRILAVEVKQSNPRIIRQAGAFLLYGIDGAKDNHPPHQAVSAYLRGNPRIVIETWEDKKNLLAELDRIGINKATLFPELDKQAEWLRALYPPKIK